MKAHLKAIAAVIVIIIVVSISYSIYSQNKEVVIKQEVQSSAQQAQFKLPDSQIKLLNDKVFLAEEFKNKIVIVNFWASWCAPCVEEVPSLINLVSKHKDLIVLAVSGDSNAEDIFAFMKSFPDFNKKPIYQMWDNNQKLLDKFKISKLPESYIFNRQGEMIKRVSGTINWDTSDVNEYFKGL
ncbi:MAG: TlpA family protein disulfide reductase [Bdellovibrionales bacterium]|nr:TlpA family protein disulfide reductase [Bdellovibrionales bacterium]